MLLNALQAALVKSDGLSAVCSLCEKFWRAREQNSPDGKCLSVDQCGSPLAGDDFHEYEGPLSDFRAWCFVCGEKSRYGLVVKGRTRVVGVCMKHVSLLAGLRPTEAIQRAPSEIRGDAGVVSLDNLLPRAKNSLAAAIAEVEQHYAKKEGREPDAP